jgi:hypothetical protein
VRSGTAASSWLLTGSRVGSDPTRIRGAASALATIELCHEGLAFCFAGPAALLELTRAFVERAGRAAFELELAPALVECELRVGAEPAPRPTRPEEHGWLTWEWAGARGRVRTRASEARLRRHSDTGAAARDVQVTLRPRYRVQAWLPAERRALPALLGGIHAAVLDDLGGLILHASSLLLEDGVLGFLGPSGAGKSTASVQLGAGSLFSVDRLAVLPERRLPSALRGHEANGAWRAYPLFGGTLPAGALARAAPSWRRLQALLRVERATHGASVEAQALARAVAVLRESSLHGGQGAGSELEFLARLEQFAREVRVGRLHFALDAALGPTVGEWLSGAQAGSAREPA